VLRVDSPEIARCPSVQPQPESRRESPLAGRVARGGLALSCENLVEMRVVLTFVVREHDRPLALSRAVRKALHAGLTRPETTRCRRRRGAWIVDVAGHVRGDR
jgi:hypothetical protein